jgi:transposase InsO family protein
MIGRTLTGLPHARIEAEIVDKPLRIAEAANVSDRRSNARSHGHVEPGQRHQPTDCRILEGVESNNGYVESFNGRMRDELLNESLFFGLNHARSAIAEWVEDFNMTRPHSSLGYQTPAAFAGLLAATGSPVAQTAPQGVTETDEALIAAG